MCATPLHQVLWKHEPLNVAFVASDANLPALHSAIHHVQKSVKLNQVHVIVIGSNSRDLREGAAFFKEKLPWVWIEVQKFNRLLSGTGGFTFTHGICIPLCHTRCRLPPPSLWWLCAAYWHLARDQHAFSCLRVRLHNCGSS